MFNDYRVRVGLVGALGVLLLLLTNGRAMTSGAAASNEEAVPSCERIADFDPNNFSDPTNIDNEAPTSELTLLGLVRHLAAVETGWLVGFGIVLLGIVR